MINQTKCIKFVTNDVVMKKRNKTNEEKKEIKNTIEEPAVGYYSTVSTPIFNTFDTHHFINTSRNGISMYQLEKIINKYDLTLKETAIILNISERTLQRYIPTDILSKDVSDRTLHLQRLYERGTDVFGSLNMIVFRICNTVYSNDISGNGAKMYGGRWNNKGVPVLYTSSTRALAALEILVHISTNNVQPIDFSILSIFLPENSIDEIPFTALKTEIDKNGLNSNFKFIGDNWIKSNSSLLLKVPSIVIPEEYNYLVNPLHKNFNKVKIVENKLFRFDNRLVTK